MYQSVVGCGIGVGKQVVSLIDYVCHMPFIIEDASEREREKTCNQSRKSGAKLEA